MPIIWVYGNHYDIWELLILNKLLCYVTLRYVTLTSIAYASENLKTFADLSRCSDRRRSLVYVVN